jgi:hypothetical protein
MNLKEINGKLIFTNNNLFVFIIGIMFFIIGLIVVISMFIENSFDFTKFESYFGLIFPIIGFLVLFFAWKRKKIIFDKNQNIFLLTEKTLLKKIKKKDSVNNIKKIIYEESLRDSNSRGSILIERRIVLFLKNSEKFILYEYASNSLVNESIKIIAKQIANYIAVEFNDLSLKKESNNFINHSFNINSN